MLVALIVGSSLAYLGVGVLVSRYLARWWQHRQGLGYDAISAAFAVLLWPCVLVVVAALLACYGLGRLGGGTDEENGGR